MPQGGKRPGAGRKPGVPNALNKSVKDAIEAAFDEVGGHQYLVGVARTNPQVFCSLLGKVLPTQVQASVDLAIVSKEQRDASVAAASRADR